VDRDLQCAFRGAISRARSPVGNFGLTEKDYPEDTSIQFSYLPVLRALEALNRGAPAKALEMTQVAAPYDLPVRAIVAFSAMIVGALSIWWVSMDATALGVIGARSCR